MKSEELLSAMLSLKRSRPPSPEAIIVDPVTYAMIRASVDFQGRNWRRIKRETNKAAKRAKKERVREETLEDAAKKIERMLAPEGEAYRENATLKLSIEAIRALKKGPSDAR